MDEEKNVRGHDTILHRKRSLEFKILKVKTSMIYGIGLDVVFLTVANLSTL